MTRKQKRLKDRRQKAMRQDYSKLFSGTLHDNTLAISDAGEPILAYLAHDFKTGQDYYIVFRVYNRRTDNCLKGYKIGEMDGYNIIRFYPEPLFWDVQTRLNIYKDLARYGKRYKYLDYKLIG